MDGYMPERVFEYGAISIAMLHVGTGRPIEEMARTVFQNYEGSYLDDNVLEQWIEAAGEAVEAIDRLFPDIDDKDEKVGTLKTLQQSVKNYAPDGKKRRKKVLGGTRFNKEKEPNYERVDQFSQHLMIYHVLLRLGKIDF